jgi:hypothetical protein
MADYVPTRIYIKMTRAESIALGALAEREHRDPRDQAALLVREGLIGRGVLAESEAPVVVVGQDDGLVRE